MAATINNLKDLAQYLLQQATTSEGRIQLTNEAPFEAIMAVVSDLLGVEKLVMSVRPADIPSNPGDTLIIKPAFTPSKPNETFLNLLGQETVITFWYETPQGASAPVLQCSLVITLRQWLFSTSFDEMGGLPVNELVPANTSPYFILLSTSRDDVTDPVTGDKVHLTKGLHYFSALELKPLEPFFTLLETSPPHLAISGSLTRTANPAGFFVFDLRAPLTAQPKPLPLLRVSSPWLGMKATYVFYDDRDTSNDNEVDEAKYTLLAYPYLGLQVEIDRYRPDGTKVSMTLDIEALVDLANNTVVFLVLPADSPDGPPQTSLDNIGNLIGGQSWDTLIPSDIKDYLNAFALKLFSLTLNLHNLSPAAMQLSLGTLKPWPIPKGGPYELDFSMDWLLLWQSGKLLQTAELSAQFKLADDFIFDVTVTVPQLVISGGYSGTLRLDFDQLADKLANFIGHKMPVPQGLPTFSFSDLFIELDFKVGAFSLEATTDANIGLFGTEILGINGLLVTINRPGSGQSVTVTLNGHISLLGLNFYVSATVGQDQDTEFELHLVDQTIGSLLNYHGESCRSLL